MTGLTLPGSWRAYGAILSARFRTLLQYRVAAVAGILAQIFFGYIRIMIFAAFYRVSGSAQPMTYEETVTYIWLGEASLLLIMFNVEAEVAAMIRSGSVAYEMARPVDLYNLWFSRIIASRAAPTLLRGLPLLLFAGFFFGMQLPHSTGAGLLFIATTVGALLLAAAFSTLMTILLFWTVSGEGVTFFMPIITMALSGLVVPLPLYPDWMQPIINFLPFRGLADTPFRLYIGHMSVHEGLSAILNQVLWILGIVGLGRLLLARGMNRLVVQGG